MPRLSPRLAATLLANPRSARISCNPGSRFLSPIGQCYGQRNPTVKARRFRPCDSRPGASSKDHATLNSNFDKVAAWAKTHNRPIYLGEFGVYDKAPMDSRVRYTDAVARAAEAQGWSWAYWQFDNDFILWDMKHDTWVEPIRHALIPASTKKP